MHNHGYYLHTGHNPADEERSNHSPDTLSLFGGPFCVSLVYPYHKLVGWVTTTLEETYTLGGQVICAMSQSFYQSPKPPKLQTGAL